MQSWRHSSGSYAQATATMHHSRPRRCQWGPCFKVPLQSLGTNGKTLAESGRSSWQKPPSEATMDSRHWTTTTNHYSSSNHTQSLQSNHNCRPQLMRVALQWAICLTGLHASGGHKCRAGDTAVGARHKPLQQSITVDQGGVNGALVSKCHSNLLAPMAKH